ncbi:thiamine-phosphate kinase [Polaribacter sp. Z014]|uniref:thiamine-phosphate kinase n=1 Tax=unclassified Polaribacter TaxID=196858 RepID=UPI00193B9EBF|nr:MULTISPECIES: thiamine-phosphate kinase [unclassified Polaribacter]MCL7762150.1 thiamine-phosphate kinase [Polaribacter sp. Z014]QVY64422.1 thiamine-phosphate kinase [Polaribacter sp. Q13]
MLEDKNTQKTSLAELGEFGLINHITQYFKVQNPSTIKAVGDDAAVLDASEKQTLVTTDLLIEGVHFDLSYMPLKHLGYKAVMVNLSDVYAMNGVAEQITVSIAVSNRFPLEAIEELYAGIQLACESYNVDLVGGDTTSSTKGILISVTAIGKAAKEDVVYRDGAKETDLIVVSGDLGAAYLGLQVLEREKQVFKVDPNNQPDLDNYTYLIERQLKPEARKDIAGLLKEMEVKPTSMIDISDGLSSELFHICTQSKVGCKVYEDKLPLDPQVISACEEFELDSTMVALSGGEDYELLFTVPIADFDKIKGNPNFSIIGHITAENQGLNLVTRASQEIELKAQGWNALKNE